MSETTAAIEVVRRHAVVWTPDEGAFASLVEDAGDAQIVLIGEATHGTHEFYRTRAELTRILIQTRGFNLVAVEADWPDAYRVNRWVQPASEEPGAEGALGDFTRFPRWMWRSREVIEFLEWLHRHDAGREASSQVGFYGLDLYSLHASIDAVLRYLDTVDPPAAERARYPYGCFEDFGEDTTAYGSAATIGLSRSCEDEVVAQLVELQRRAADYARRDGRVAADEYFFAEQNARLVRSAEAYYRAMFGGRVESWNLRDTHMSETLDALLAHSARTTGHARAVVWAHNSHVGDARATQMSASGELTLGQLVRQRHGSHVYIVGFTTHEGAVTAASSWDARAERKHVRPSLEASIERLFHETGLPSFLLRLREPPVRRALAVTRLERAIGIIYRPETERVSHDFHALPDQFDAVVHVDRSTALEPLEPWAVTCADVPETYPTGMS